MIDKSYWTVVFNNGKLEDKASEVSYPDYPSPIMGEVIFHNVQLLNQFFNKGEKWG